MTILWAFPSLPVPPLFFFHTSDLLISAGIFQVLLPTEGEFCRIPPLFLLGKEVVFSLCLSVLLTIYYCMHVSVFYFSSLFVDKSRERHMFLKSLSLSLCLYAR